MRNSALFDVWDGSRETRKVLEVIDVLWRSKP
jgi:hypothetical protein